MTWKPEFNPEVALITGAGRGLGRELSMILAKRGMRVCALGRRPEDLKTLQEQASEGHIFPVMADVSNPTSLRSAFRQIDEQHGPIDILINNAAVYPKTDFLDETPESFMETMQINLGGMLACSQLALKRMIRTGQGRIINITSFAGDNPTHLSAAYSVSKGAGRILTKAMLRDIGDRFPRIVISDWIPGALNTNMGHASGHSPDVAAEWGATLALWHDPSLNGITFVENRELLPQLSLKRRIFNRATGQTLQPRKL